MTSFVAAVLAILHVKHDNNIWSLCEMLEKTLQAKDSISPSSFSLGHNNLLFHI